MTRQVASRHSGNALRLIIQSPFCWIPSPGRSPEHASLGILKRHEGEKSAHRHLADLAEAFAENAVTKPGALQMNVFNTARVQLALGARRSRLSGNGGRSGGWERHRGLRG